MRNISAKADGVGDTLPASDFNANLRSELQNVVTSSGQTLDAEGGPDTDVEMLGKAITIYSNASQYYQDSGAANAYVLARAGNLKPLVDYIDGVTVVFKAGNSNTGASTINVDSLGAKALRDNTDTALVGGEIKANGYVVARYRSGTDRFEIISSQSESTIPLPSTSQPFQTPQVNADGDGYNLSGPLYEFRNKFINPWMESWQRGGELGGSAINVTVSDTYTADRMVLIFDGTADVDVEQVALGTALKIGHRWVVNGLKVTVNTNSGNSYLRLCQRIEKVSSFVDHPFVLQSYIQGSGTLTVPVYLKQDFGTAGSSDVVTAFDTSLSVTSSMQKLLTGVDVPDVSGKTIVDADSFLSVEYDLINLASTDYIIIPFHQFEPGENESNPEWRNDQIENRLIWRYLFNWDANKAISLVGGIRSTVSARTQSPIDVRTVMRTISINASSVGDFSALFSATGTCLATFNSLSGATILWDLSSASGGTLTAGEYIIVQPSTGDILYLDAELYE